MGRAAKRPKTPDLYPAANGQKEARVARIRPKIANLIARLMIEDLLTFTTIHRDLVEPLKLACTRDRVDYAMIPAREAPFTWYVFSSSPLPALSNTETMTTRHGEPKILAEVMLKGSTCG